MGAVGLEHPSQSPEKPRITHTGDAESGAVRMDSLAELVKQVLALPMSDEAKAKAIGRLVEDG